MAFSDSHMHAAKGCELTLRQDKAQPLLLSHSTLRLKRSRSPQTRVGAIRSTAIFQMLAGVATALEQWLDLHVCGIRPTLTPGT